jgi:hypothetical protein
MAKDTATKDKPAGAGATGRKGPSPSPAAPQAAAEPPSVSPQPAVGRNTSPAPDPVVVVELVNGMDGVWKKLSNGKRVDLTTKEWRQELARLFTRAPAP